MLDSGSAYIYIGQSREKNKTTLSNAPPDQNIETFTHCIIVKVIEDNSYFSEQASFHTSHFCLNIVAYKVHFKSNLFYVSFMLKTLF